MDCVLYTRIEPDIDLISDHPAERLAKLAIKSAELDAGKKCKDGISYLINAKKKWNTYGFE